MAAERRRQIEELYRAALERGRAVLADADPELLREVESLLDRASRLPGPPAAMPAEQSTATCSPSDPSGVCSAPVATDADAKSTAALEIACGTEETEPVGKRLPPLAMWLIAAAFLTHVLFFGCLLFFGPEAVGLRVTPGEGHPLVTGIIEGSPAHRAGIRAGDRLSSAGGRPISGVLDWYSFLSNLEAGPVYRIEAMRDGYPFECTLTLERRTAGYWLTARGVVVFCGFLVSVGYLSIACFIAFMRPDRLLACVGALLLAIGSSVRVGPLEGFDSTLRQWPLPAQALLWLASVLNTIGFGVLFTFFALFPRPSFERRWPWVAAWTPVLVLASVFNYHLFRTAYNHDGIVRWPSWLEPVSAAYWIIYLPTSFVLLAKKYRQLTDPTEKRRVRVFVSGLAMLLLAVPTVVYSLGGFESVPGAALFRSVPVVALATLLAFAFPLSFAYAILRHQLFDIRVMVRQSLRYAAARKVLLLLVPAIMAALMLDVYGHREKTIDAVLGDRGWIYLGLAALAASLHHNRRRWLEAIDRRFFREQYDAREILRSTLETVYAASDLDHVAPTVVRQLEAAVHAQFCAIVVRELDEMFYRPVAVCPDQVRPPLLSKASKIVELSKLLAKPVAISPDQSEWLRRQLTHDDWRRILQSGISLLAPVRSADYDAMLLLGKKRSDEPFSSEDVRLVEDVTIGLSLLSRPRSAPFESCSECPTCGRCYEATLEACPDDGSTPAIIALPLRVDGRFRLQRRIGRGGMGVVYEAADLQLDRKVAVKVISQDRIGTRDVLERFRRESRILAGFQHPNVVTLHDFGVTSGGQPFLVMELLSGVTLRQELQRRHILSPKEIEDIVHQICAALAVAHRRSLVHRDLKPENILLCDAQENPCKHGAGARAVKILDFGLAKLTPEPPTGDNGTVFSTEIGKIVGTPSYLPPEALLGSRAQQSADIWALSVLTCEMMTGKNPFAGNGTATDVLQRLPWEWADFFRNCLSRDPADRPTSVEGFLATFDRIFG